MPLPMKLFEVSDVVLKDTERGQQDRCSYVYAGSMGGEGIAKINLHMYSVCIAVDSM